MNIRVTSDGHTIHLTLPTVLLLNSFVLNRVLKLCRLTQTPPELPAGAAPLAAELRRVRKIRGTWTLVEFHSANGEQVTITV